MQSNFMAPPEWNGPSNDPNDEQFGDIVEFTTLSNAAQYDAVLVGEPYDGGHIIAEPGARHGPEKLRETLARTKTHHYSNGPVNSIGDLGDIDYPLGQTVQDTQRAITDVTAEIHDCETLPIFLGGDHSLGYCNVAPLLERFDSVGVINIDSHADVREFVDGQPHTGTPMRQLYEAGLEEYVIVGAREFGLSTPYVEYLDARGAKVITALEASRDIEAVVDRSLAVMADVDAIYVSFDVDVLDLGVASGMSGAEPGGLLSREVYEALSLLAPHPKVEGFGIYELTPILDTVKGHEAGGLTVTTVARGLAHFLSWYQTS